MTESGLIKCWHEYSNMNFMRFCLFRPLHKKNSRRAEYSLSLRRQAHGLPTLCSLNI